VYIKNVSPINAATGDSNDTTEEGIANVRANNYEDITVWHKTSVEENFSGFIPETILVDKTLTIAPKHEILKEMIPLVKIFSADKTLVN